jgi:tetratricopeptide (TPR) repeat protein
LTVVGGAGFGKSQLAFEYAYRYALEYDYIWVVNAADTLSLERAYREFAIRTDLPSAGTEEFEQVLTHVRLWLEGHSRFLFIYDNAEGLSSKLLGYLPCGHLQGRILINTRDSRCRLSNTLIDLKDFPFDGVKFLQKRLENTCVVVSSDDAECLAVMLKHFPLALEHAAAFMERRQQTCAYYMKLFERVELSKVLDDDSVHLTVYDKTIAKTWRVSIDEIKSKSARQLFNLCIYFAPDDIPLSLFIKGRDNLPVELRDVLLPGEHSKHDCLVGELARYSLLSFGRKDNGDILLFMHRLIQATVFRDLANDTQWVSCCLDMMTAVFEYKYGDKESMDAFTQDVSHVLKIAYHAEEMLDKNDESVQKKIACLYGEAGRGFYYSGEYSKALEWYNKSLVIKERVLGTDHPSTADTYNNIALVYGSQGKYVEALEWYNKALSIYKKIFGENYEFTKTVQDRIKSLQSMIDQ